MATAPTQHYGAIAAFDSTKESWTNYVERLSFYFIANDIAEDANGKRKAILLFVCGHETYQLIRNLVGGAEAIKDAQYADMIKLITDNYNPPPSVTVQRFKFNSRLRHKDESIATYIAALRQLAEHCKFGDTLSDMLRDRLVCGVNHNAIQRRLLSEKEPLTFDLALKLAKALESAEQNSADLQTGVQLGNKLDKQSLSVHKQTHKQSRSLH